MGILHSSKPLEKPTASTAKRRSVQANLADLKPLKSGGARGFSGIRDSETRSGKSGSLKKKSDGDAMDSDDDEVEETGKGIKLDDAGAEDLKDHVLSPEDIRRQGELAEGVKKIKVKTYPHSVNVLLKLINRCSLNASTPSSPPMFLLRLQRREDPHMDPILPNRLTPLFKAPFQILPQHSLPTLHTTPQTVRQVIVL